VDKVDVHSNQVAADDPVPAHDDIQQTANTLSIGNINSNINHQLLNNGNFSQLFTAGTFGERSVAVEKIPVSHVDASVTVTWLLNLNNINVVKILLSEQNSDYKYYKLRICISISYYFK
jgi:hypothetical protein